MAELQVKEKNLLQNVESLLERKPDAYDVTFCVGSEKKQVRGIKLLLKAASPVFEKEFEERWEVGIIQNGQGIPLPDFNPEVFQLFIKLTMLDTWSNHVLTGLNLPPNQMLNLLSICCHFQMEKGAKKLQKMAETFFESFDQFQKSEDFLELSKHNLKTVLSSDNILMGELDLFECTMKWAHAQCSKSNMEATQENLRIVLGDCLQEIRFPLMTCTEFTQATEDQDILTSDETLKIYKYIGMNTTKKSGITEVQFPFKTNPRMRNQELNVRSQLPPYKILFINKKNQKTHGEFSCKGTLNSLFIQSSKPITLHGVGFVGPVDSDAFHDVTVEIKPYFDFMGFKGSGKMKKRIFTKKGETCFFQFDHPFTIKGNELDSSRNDVAIYYSLLGPNVPFFVRNNDRDLLLQHSGINFNFTRWGNQIAELYFHEA